MAIERWDPFREFDLMTRLAPRHFGRWMQMPEMTKKHHTHQSPLPKMARAQRQPSVLGVCHPNAVPAASSNP